MLDLWVGWVDGWAGGWVGGRTVTQNSFMLACSPSTRSLRRASSRTLLCILGGGGWVGGRVGGWLNELLLYTWKGRGDRGGWNELL